MLIAFFIGVLAGWLASVPIAGPISALVVARGIEGRFKAGGYIAFGGGLVEAMYAFLAFWGFGTFLAQYPLIEPLSQAGGAIVLGVLGVMFMRKQEQRAAPEVGKRESAWSNFALGAWICGINPTLLATWSGFIATVHGSGLVDLTDTRLAAPMATGCAVGITGWFLVLIGIIRRYRERFRAETLTKLIRVMGVFLLCLSLWFAWRFVTYLREFS